MSPEEIADAELFAKFPLWVCKRGALGATVIGAAMTERGLVNVEIVKKGEGGCGGRPASDVQIRTTRGETVWVPETDVIARKPNPEEKA